MQPIKGNHCPKLALKRRSPFPPSLHVMKCNHRLRSCNTQSSLNSKKPRPLPPGLAISQGYPLIAIASKPTIQIRVCTLLTKRATDNAVREVGGLGALIASMPDDEVGGCGARMTSVCQYQQHHCMASVIHVVSPILLKSSRRYIHPISKFQ